MSRFGRAEELDRQAQQAGARVTGHDEFLRRYGRFGFETDGGGRVGDAAFRNLAMTPNFPWVGEIAADLYAQTTGRRGRRDDRDGSLRRDRAPRSTRDRSSSPSSTVCSRRTPPCRSSSATSTSLGAADNERRADALAEAARLTFEALLSGVLPEPVTLAHDFSPLVSERRLLMWSADPAEQALLERVRMAGRIPPLDGADGWAVTVSNGGREQDRQLPGAPRPVRLVHRLGRDDGDAPRRAHQHRTRRRAPAVRHRQPDRRAGRDEPAVRVVLQPARPHRRHARR